MIVRTLAEIEGTERDVDAETWRSRRLMLAGDGARFSLNDTLIRAGTRTHIWYKHHLEAVYCIEGRGRIHTVADGKVYEIHAGTLYVLDGHEEHFLEADESGDMRMICVFDPPLTGREVHGEDGAYPPAPAAE
jgi:L-ectoine synthase